MESEIIPSLSNNVVLVFFNGTVLENQQLPKEYITHALFKSKNYSKLPHLMKFRNGRSLDKSVSTLFYAVKNQNKSKETLLAEINNFFEMNCEIQAIE